MGQRPNKPLRKFKITVIRYYSRYLDFDNAVASVKPLIDGMKHAGVIKDDTFRMTGKWDVDQVLRPKRDGCMVHIKIESR